MYRFTLTIFFTLYSLLASANQSYYSDPLAESFRQLGSQPANSRGQRSYNAVMQGFASGIQGAVNQRKEAELLELQKLARRNAELSLQLENQRLDLALEQQKSKQHKQSVPKIHKKPLTPIETNTNSFQMQIDSISLNNQSSKDYYIFDSIAKHIENPIFIDPVKKQDRQYIYYPEVISMLEKELEKQNYKKNEEYKATIYIKLYYSMGLSI